MRSSELAGPLCHLQHASSACEPSVATSILVISQAEGKGTGPGQCVCSGLEGMTQKLPTAFLISHLGRIITWLHLAVSLAGRCNPLLGIHVSKTLFFLIFIIFFDGFPGGSDGKEYAFSVGDSGLIPGLGRSPGEGDGNPLQYSCLGNPIY